LDCGEALQVLVVCHHINWRSGAFEVMSPDLECLKDGQEFFVVGVIVQFRDTEGSGMESNRVNLSIQRNSGKACIRLTHSKKL
jgi:hypothetical protein